jgi:hypothetical protein
MPSERPILVTGSIRSGTTWVGRVLGTAPGVALIHEPFNEDHPVGVFAHRWSHQYAYVTEGDDETKEIERAMKDTLGFRYRPLLHLGRPETPRRTVGILRDLPRSWFRRHLSRPRPLIKDPIALLSADWLSERFDMDVVVMVRHPGAFAWSYRRIAEPNRFADLLEQKTLMDGPLAPYVEEVERGARTGDPIEQSAILWRVLYSIVDRYQSRHPDWVVVRHEDLSVDPYLEFLDLFEGLGLSFTEKTRRFIDRTTSELNRVEAPEGRLHHIRRNSRDNVSVWRRRLSPEEVARVRELTADVADRFYTASSWSGTASIETGTVPNVPEASRL